MAEGINVSLLKTEDRNTKVKIYCIGNSHASFFTNTIPGCHNEWRTDKNGIFISRSIGAVIAYNFTTSHLSEVRKHILENKQFSIKKDYIMPIVGEVDCRYHLPIQMEIQKRTMESIVEEAANRFFKSLLILKKENYKVIGWGGHPSTIKTQKDISNIPIYGTCLERNRISIYWNNCIRKKCKIHNIPFISICEDLIDEQGLTKMEYFRDFCHLKTEPLIDKVIEKLKLRKIIK